MNTIPSVGLGYAIEELIDEEQHLAERNLAPCPVDPDRPCACLNGNVPPNGCEPIHHFFSLSYASYLVLRRSVLQSMPKGWQARFVALLNELDDATDDLDDPVHEWKVIGRGDCRKRVLDPYADYDRGRRVVPLKTEGR